MVEKIILVTLLGGATLLLTGYFSAPLLFDSRTWRRRLAGFGLSTLGLVLGGFLLGWGLYGSPSAFLNRLVGALAT